MYVTSRKADQLTNDYGYEKNLSKSILSWTPKNSDKSLPLIWKTILVCQLGSVFDFRHFFFSKWTKEFEVSHFDDLNE